MSYPNSLFWDALEPTWVNLAYGQEPDDFIYVTDYGTKIISNSGNNGAYASGRVKGVAVGRFKIAFKLGYTWGWSSFYAANIKTLTSTGSIAPGDYNVSGSNGLRFLNNNSNNKLEISKGVGGTSTLLTDTTGVADSTVINLWRNSSNVVKYRIGSANVVTVGTMADPWTFYHIAQSPCSCALITAHNDTRDAS